MIYKGVHISDIHFGAVENAKLNNELSEVFFKYLDSNPDINYITINGDLLDRKLNLNESYSKSSIDFINNLVQYLKNDNYKLDRIRLIRGTKTHDFNQLENFKYFEKDYPEKFKIINTYDIEKLYNDFRVVYLPEEYMEDQDNYYKNLKEELVETPCDCIFGHGSWDVFSFENQVIESERNISGSPILRYKEWCDLCKGFIIFGHIHKNLVYKDKLYYTGSFSRWIFGEDNPKGFYMSIYNTETSQYNLRFIKNNLANVYKTYFISDIMKENMSLEQSIEEIDKLSKSEKVYKHRILLDEQIDTEKLKVLKETVSTYDDIKIDQKIKVKQKEQDTRFSFLDENNSVIKNISLYIKNIFGKDISENTISEILIENQE
jgi:hypothetical protein